ncbi:uroporphyrinogen-III C-methyltransferase [Lutibacter oricola]|uniref:uroporphyrinogen-III C-methyltransferase n=1 Tax=Lutibacter oricola TaxID=762486 RepID=A0A1H2TKX6_9FLAO|nr:uroporphyrinogen-III C-methyltransferase [Lutibacter oricola]SDW44470.1 uroporphyrinogen-III C-methyltransferase [Lutibacter oricola]
MSVKNNNSKVTLVGAGPGDKDLITLKGVSAIEQADCILYDALVNPEILEYTKKGTPCIYVGKRFNNHRLSQDEINELLVSKALELGHVVRLKGGDPFVFGRGSEEIDYIESFNIQTEIIPGISSSLAIPAMQGIPLTKRTVNESFWVITGTTSNGNISKDIQLGAQSSATLVILMGLRNFSLIMEEIKRYRHKYTPFAIIQNGSLPNETIVIDTIENYKNTIESIDYSSPGIIVIGDVVAEHPSYLDEEIQRVLNSYM